MPRIACSASTTGAIDQPRASLSDLFLQAVAPLLRLGNGVDLLLQHDLLRGMREAEPGEPTPVCRRPGLAAREQPIVAQQEALELLPGPSQRLHGGHARSDQVAHRLMRRIRDPDRRQLAGAMQPGQRDRVAPVGLHPLACSLRHERRRHHRAAVAESGDLPVQAVAARARLVTDAELAVLLAQPLDQAPHGVRPVGDLALEPHLAQPPRLGHSHRDLRLVRIQPDAHRPILSHGSSPMSEARRRLDPAQPSSATYVRRATPASLRGHGV